MKELKRKQLLDTFCEKLNSNFHDYCHQHEKEVDIDMFITYIVDQELISASKIRQYTIVQTYEDLHIKKKRGKTQTVTLLASRFNLSTRSIWNVFEKIEKVIIHSGLL